MKYIQGHPDIKVYLAGGLLWCHFQLHFKNKTQKENHAIKEETDLHLDYKVTDGGVHLLPKLFLNLSIST